MQKIAPSSTQTTSFSCCNWCGKQVTRIASPLPVKHKLKELLIRIALILTGIVPLFGLLSILCSRKPKITPTEKIDPLPKLSPPPQIAPEKEIFDGYGDFILRFQGSQEIVDYKKASEILESYQVIRWIEKHPEQTPQQRIEALENELHQLDPRLEFTFIPKTLYELFFLRQTIDEDVEKAKNFPYKDPQRPTEDELNSVRYRCYSNRNSWLKFKKRVKGVPVKEEELEDFYGPLIVRHKEENPEKRVRLKEISHRLNGAIQNQLNKFPRNLTMGQINELLEEQISFFKDHGTRFEPLVNSVSPGPSSHFTTESERGGLRPMKVADDGMANIFRHAVHLECSEEARGKAVLYRGGNIGKDTPIREGRCFSLSYGVSPFAGIVQDPGATAYHYMRTRKRDAYALLVDPKDPNDSELFHAPPSFLSSIFEEGEYFHGRSKAYLIPEGGSVYGHNLGGSFTYKEFPHKSKLPKDRFTHLFQEKMRRAYLLKPALA